jgi:hypothetical protein
VPLTGISSGAPNENQTLLVTANSSDVTVVLNPSIDYNSPNPTGALTITPAPGAHGSATVSVTVNDGQSENNLLVRSFTVTVAAPAPSITQISRVSAGSTRITFTTVAGQEYTLEYTTTLQGGEWIPLSTIIGTGGPVALEDLPATESMRFYRIRLE